MLGVKFEKRVNEKRKGEKTQFEEVIRGEKANFRRGNGRRRKWATDTAPAICSGAIRRLCGRSHAIARSGKVVRTAGAYPDWAFLTLFVNVSSSIRLCISSRIIIKPGKQEDSRPTVRHNESSTRAAPWTDRGFVIRLIPPPLYDRACSVGKNRIYNSRLFYRYGRLNL